MSTRNATAILLANPKIPPKNVSRFQTVTRAQRQPSWDKKKAAEPGGSAAVNGEIKLLLQKVAHC